MEQAAGKYSDIIFLPRPISKRHIPMAQISRAAQFASFAALSGYDNEIREAGRLTDSRSELDEDRQNALNNALMRLSECTDRPFLKVTYFCPDKNKSGGRYITVSGNFRRIDEESLEIVFTDGRKIPALDIYDIVIEH